MCSKLQHNNTHHRKSVHSNLLAIVTDTVFTCKALQQTGRSPWEWDCTSEKKINKPLNKTLPFSTMSMTSQQADLVPIDYHPNGMPKIYK